MTIFVKIFGKFFRIAGLGDFPENREKTSKRPQKGLFWAPKRAQKARKCPEKGAFWGVFGKVFSLEPREMATISDRRKQGTF